MRWNGELAIFTSKRATRKLPSNIAIDGVLHYAMPPISKDWHSTIISRIKVMSELDIAERRIPQDGRFVCATKAA